MLILVAIALLILLSSPWNLVAFVVVTLLWLLELAGWSRTVKHRRKVVGAQTLIGEQAVVVVACRPDGQVKHGGEIWGARCTSGAAVGETVRIVGLNGLTLEVERA